MSPKPMTTKGITAKHMQKYYLTVAVPKMLYAADIFLVPATKRSKGIKGHINKLAEFKGRWPYP